MSDRPTLAHPRRGDRSSRRHIGPRRDRRRRDARAPSASSSLDDLMDAAVPGGIRSAARPRPARRRSRGRGRAPSCGRSPRATSPPSSMIGLGLPRHDHPAGHPAQRAREPRLVHRLHARTSPRSPRAGSRRCSTSRPWSATSPGCRPPTPRCSTRRTAAAEAMTLVRRGASARPTAPFVVDADALPQTHRRSSRTRAEAAGHRGRRRPTSTDGLPDGELLRRAACSTPARPGRSATRARVIDGRPRARARWPSSPPTCSR